MSAAPLRDAQSPKNGQFRLPEDYTSRPAPEYHHEDAVAESGVVWQPEVYELARLLSAARSIDQIIDIGCGNGQKLARMYAPRRIGIDFGPNIEWCRTHHPWGEWMEADLENGGDQTILKLITPNTLVICADVVEHLVDPRPLVEIWRAAYRAGAVVITSTPDRVLVRGADHKGPPGNPAHVREWALEEYIDFLNSSGLPVSVAGRTIDNDHDRQTTTIVTVHDGMADLALSKSRLGSLGQLSVRFSELGPWIEGLRLIYGAKLGAAEALTSEKSGNIASFTDPDRRARGRDMSSAEVLREQNGAAPSEGHGGDPVLERFVLLATDAAANQVKYKTTLSELEDVKRDLRAAAQEKRTLGADRDELRARTTELEGRIASEVERSDILERRRDELDAALDQSRAEMDTLRARIAELEAAQSNATHAKGELDASNKALQAELETLRAKVAQLSEAESGAAKAKAELDAIWKTNVDLNAANKTLQSELEALRAEHAKNSKAISAKDEEIARIAQEAKTEVDAVRKASDELKAAHDQALAQVRADHDNAQAANVDLKAANETLTAELHALRQEHDKARTLIADKEGEISRLAGEAETERKALGKTNADLQAANERLDAELDALRSERDQLRADHALLAKQLAAAKTENDALGKDASEARNESKRAGLRLAAVNAENLQLRDGVWRAQQAGKALEEEKAQQLKRADALESDLKRLAAELAAAKASLEAERVSLTEQFETQNQKLREDLADTTRQLGEFKLEAKRSSLRAAAGFQENLALRDGVWRAQQSNKALEDEKSQLLQRADRLEQDVERLSAELQKSRKTIEAEKATTIEQFETQTQRLRDDLSETTRELGEIKLQAKRASLRAAAAFEENLALRDGVWRLQNQLENTTPKGPVKVGIAGRTYRLARGLTPKPVRHFVLKVFRPLTPRPVKNFVLRIIRSSNNS
ncbi:MAG: hypothetical protein R3C52_06875 [Hyphomonadaceae bacterium]